MLSPNLRTYEKNNGSMTKREKALAIVDNYSVYHAGTAVTVGAFGGQFGVDTVALTGLTTMMIEEICNVYGIHERKAKNIHIASAIARLTYKGTVIAKTILNWVPLGCFANGATTYFLTRSAGLKCIEEIEKGKMNVQDQLVQSVKDAAVVMVKSELGNGIEHISNQLAENVADNVKEILQCDVSQDLGVDHMVSYLDKISTEAMVGIDKAIGAALRASVTECLKGDAKRIDTSEILRKTILSSLTAMIDEHTKMSEAEVHFRIMANDEHYKTFESFLHNTAEYFDKIEKERGVYEAIKYCISSISDGCKVYFGLTSQNMLDSILDNPYDKAIESVYHYYLPNICDCDNYESIWAKSSILYQKLVMINFKYNIPNVCFDRVDDKLIYMIAGRIKESTELLRCKSTQSVAYDISQFIRKNAKYLNSHISIPIIGLDENLWRKEYERLYKSNIVFWTGIIKKNKTERSTWSDCVMLYIRLLRLNQLHRGHFEQILKDDNLIYNIAEIIKPEMPILGKYTVEQIAYFIAETYDRYMLSL